MFPGLTLAHGNLENMSQVISGEVTSLKKEKSSVNSLPCDVLGIVLRATEREGERERERERERGGGGGEEKHSHM